ncbi:Uncharacterised protein [Mycobacteroides abscessus]|nr:Uncharacterised protein [Mycobacteroides abscessus]
MHAPIRGLGGHDVEVTVNQQGTAIRARPGQPREEVSAPRGAGLDVLTGVSDLLQLLLNPPRAFGLALGGLQLSGVGGVETDQRADQIDDLILGCRVHRSHNYLSYHRRWRRTGLR